MSRALVRNAETRSGDRSPRLLFVFLSLQSLVLLSVLALLAFALAREPRPRPRHGDAPVTSARSASDRAS